MKPANVRGHLPCSVAMVVLCALLVGCVKSRIAVKVFKDGSGQIVLTQLHPRSTCEQYMAQLQERARREVASKTDVAGSPGRDANDVPFFREKQIRKLAKAFGPTVRYVGARPVRIGGAQGYVALYSFKDVGDVHVDMAGMAERVSRSLRSDPDEREGNEDEGAGREGSDASGFGFRFEAGSPARLTVTTPEPTTRDRDGDAGDEEVEVEPPTRAESPPEPIDMYDLMSPTMIHALQGLPFRCGTGRLGYSDEYDGSDYAMQSAKGLEIGLTVEVDGSPVKCTATHRDPKAANRLILLDLNLARDAGNPAVKRHLCRLIYGDFGQFLTAPDPMPGACMETNREVVVEFN